MIDNLTAQPNQVQNWNYRDGQYSYPIQYTYPPGIFIAPQTYPHYVYVDRIVEPTHCLGKAHVFECDHEPTCKCGKIRRIA